MNAYPDVTLSESEEGEGVWELIQILFLIQIGQIYSFTIMYKL